MYNILEDTSFGPSYSLFEPEEISVQKQIVQKQVAEEITMEVLQGSKYIILGDKIFIKNRGNRKELINQIIFKINLKFQNATFSGDIGYYSSSPKELVHFHSFVVELPENMVFLFGDICNNYDEKYTSILFKNLKLTSKSDNKIYNDVIFKKMIYISDRNIIFIPPSIKYEKISKIEWKDTSKSNKETKKDKGEKRKNKEKEETSKRKKRKEQEIEKPFETKPKDSTMKELVPFFGDFKVYESKRMKNEKDLQVFLEKLEDKQYKEIRLSMKSNVYEDCEGEILEFISTSSINYLDLSAPFESKKHDYEWVQNKFSSGNIKDLIECILKNDHIHHLIIGSERTMDDECLKPIQALLNKNYQNLQLCFSFNIPENDRISLKDILESTNCLHLYLDKSSETYIDFGDDKDIIDSFIKSKVQYLSWVDSNRFNKSKKSGVLKFQTEDDKKQSIRFKFKESENLIEISLEKTQ